MTTALTKPAAEEEAIPIRRIVRTSFSVRFSRALSRLLVKLKVSEVPHIKRIIVTVVGGTIIIFGFSLIWTPAPTGLLIPVGLAVLGTEYAWARRWLRKARLLAGRALVRTQEIIGTREKPVEVRKEEAETLGR